MTRVAAGGISLACALWGEEPAPTAVLVHGNGGHAAWWEPLVPSLVPGWRVIAPDLRGHGASDWAEPPRYRMDDYVADLEAVLAALAPSRVVLVGHSMGGRVVVAYAAAHPERVAGVALLDTRLRAVVPAEARRWRASAAGRREGRSYPTRAAAVAAFRFVPDEREVAPPVVARLAEQGIVEHAPGDWRFRFDRAVLALDGDGARDLMRVLGRLACPLLIMAGSSSWVLDANERAALVAAAPSAAVQVFRGGHHFLLVEPAAVGASLRRFLDATCPPARGG